MPLRGSRACRQAQANAVARDLVQLKLISILNESIREDQTRQVADRAARLVLLFTTLTGERAASLQVRLGDRKDYLSKLFDCELSTPFRTYLRRLLARQVAPGLNESAAQEDEVPEEPEPEEPEPEEPEPEEPEPEEPEPEEDPPPPGPDGRIVSNIRDYLKDMLSWVNARLESSPPEFVRDLLARLEAHLKAALVLAASAIVAAALGYFAYDTLRREMFRTVASSATHLGTERIISYFEHSREFTDLDRELDAIESVRDEIELSDRREQQQRESEIQVEPRTRGFNVEDVRVQELSHTGFRGLPDRYPVFDALRGKVSGRFPQVYRDADAVSIKSTQVTEAKNLLPQFRRKMLRPLVNVKLPLTDGAVEIASLKSKTLELIFEHGSIGRFTSGTEAAIEEMKKQCKASGITFRWYFIVGESTQPGDDFLKAIKRAN
jgi:hypothetical protein